MYQENQKEKLLAGKLDSLIVSLKISYKNSSRLSETQRKLQKPCKTQGVDFSLQNLFTNPEKKYKFLSFNSKLKFSNCFTSYEMHQKLISAIFRKF